MFFFKQKTAYEMRISDWSSDVCSSDLFALFGQKGLETGGLPQPVGRRVGDDERAVARRQHDARDIALDPEAQREPVAERKGHLDPHGLHRVGGGVDRKSTRLNSSH